MSTFVRVPPVEWGVTLAAAAYPAIINQPLSATQPHLSQPLSPTSLEAPFFRGSEDTFIVHKNTHQPMLLRRSNQSSVLAKCQNRWYRSNWICGTSGSSARFELIKHRYVKVKMVLRGPNDQYETPEEWQGKVQHILTLLQTQTS